MTMKAERASVTYRSPVSFRQTLPPDFVAVCLLSSLGLAVSLLAITLGIGGEISDILFALG